MIITLNIANGMIKQIVLEIPLNPIRFAIYTDKKINYRPFGLDYIESTKTLSRKDMKKLTISKGSYIALIILLVLTVLSIVL